MDDLTPEQRHKNMTHIRSQDTKPEVKLRKALWKRGIRYRKNYKLLPGKPDIAITRFRIAVFVDGDFFHGKNIEKIKTQVKSNREYWIPKIERNIERDKQVNDELTELGWLVLRFWESDIKKDLKNCVSSVLEYCIK
ncbi:very short patch repair endonuclease [uncultured Dialister sp.]|uniref:very short patch repair endonuclease n=1 Tax=uncultured Dialister sp. TaxID=278064 RepID=UPI0025E889D2|nr:very short patch repair endonuclease [uncultured Dialister sp.]